ncbi:hypothetical protein BJ138DRAFT_564287 [Hygrophoropsis aurantiaca]|uniref:Uncharacterized protein n=1 Tax=Hygrophoropsis aurantiaca TaxID=72124 RepID=A0ACB8A0H6_9AGAM|nr:hypothetical protein BJ138DRAFT_564287 [Hygrophoropsis aurantiaca]
MLTLSSSHYYSKVRGSNVNIAMNAAFLLMWERIGAFSPFRKIATHAAHFWLETRRPYSSLALAHFLSTFCSMYSTPCASETPEVGSNHVVGLGFFIGDYGVAGTILCHERSLDPMKDLTWSGHRRLQL